MNMSGDKKGVLLIVTGGIAAYKGLDLLRLFQKEGFEVRVVMTENACEFVGPLSFETLSHNEVFVDQLDSNIPHIALGQWADAVVVAPASANFLAKAAAGLADDLASTLMLALPRETPVVVCPAMNNRMWENPAVQRNVGIMQSLNPMLVLVEPVVRELACGTCAKGGLAELTDIVAATLKALKSG